MQTDLTSKQVTKKYTFFEIKTWQKKKTNMSELIEKIIVRAQQNFDVVGGINPIQIEIEDDRVLNIF